MYQICHDYKHGYLKDTIGYTLLNGSKCTTFRSISRIYLIYFKAKNGIIYHKIK